LLHGVFVAIGTQERHRCGRPRVFLLDPAERSLSSITLLRRLLGFRGSPR
jgi:hypothetical protein